MVAHIDYYFSLASPWTYLGGERFEALVERFGSEVSYRPVNIGEIFPVSGGLPVNKRAPQRQAYRMMELRRWREHLGVPLTLEPKYFPVSDELAARTVVAAEAAGVTLGPLVNAFLHTVWVDEGNIADAQVLKGVLRDLGLDERLVDQAESDPAIAAKRDAYTKAAIELGIFGAPSWVIGGEIFWGQDRLDFVERKLAKSAG